jgi:hypothetical protein
MKYFLFLFIILSYSVVAKDHSVSYEKAYEIEKISPRFAIPLYEEIVNHTKKSSMRSTALDRLFYLYSKYNMFEDLLILNEKHQPDKNRKKRTAQIIQKMSIEMGVEEKNLANVLALAVKKEPSIKESLLESYRLTPNFNLFKYIFSIKIKTGDTDTLQYLLSELSGISPVFKIAYLLKLPNVDITKEVKQYAALSGLSNQQKMDILFFYAMYLRKIKRYKLSIRYFIMSSSFNNYKVKNFIDRSTVEASKTLIISGRSGEGCKLVSKADIMFQNESDELLDMYCKRKAILTIKRLKPSLEILAETENGIFFKKIIKVIE